MQGQAMKGIASNNTTTINIQFCLFLFYAGNRHQCVEVKEKLNSQGIDAWNLLQHLPWQHLGKAPALQGRKTCLSVQNTSTNKQQKEITRARETICSD